MASCTRNNTVLLYELDSVKKGEFNTTLYEFDLENKASPIVGFEPLGPNSSRLLISSSSGNVSSLRINFDEGSLVD